MANLLVNSCYRLIKPIALFLLEMGVSYQEFDQVARKAFVDTATERFGIRNRPTSVSRVAAMTGLSRREVTRLREKEIAMLRRTNRPSRILDGWFHDDAYLDAMGEPLVLPLKSEDGSPDFYSLVARYGGDIPPIALLRELVRSGSVKRMNGGFVEPVSSLHMTDVPSADALNRFGVVLERLAKTITTNLSPYRTGPPRFERTIYGLVHPSDLPGFNEFLSETGHEFLVLQDQWLTNRCAKGGDSIRAGAGLYYFEDSD